MPAYMLDTDTVSFALRGEGRVAARLLEHRPSELCISSITLAELRYGAEARRSRKLHRLISTFVEPIEVVSFDQSAADRFAGIAVVLVRRGEAIGTFDTPFSGSCVITADDVRHQQYPALQTCPRAYY
jgi:tRNA(fMet)-specific endonuclease VapC